MLDSIMAFMTKYEIIVKFIAPLVTALIAILNIIFVVLVFKLNSRLSQSKLSVTPSYLGVDRRSRFINNLDEKYCMTRLTQTIRGLPKIDIDLPYSKDEFKTKDLIITIDNKGDLASSNIKVHLIFKGYGTKCKYDEKNDLVSRVKRKLFYKKKRIIQVPYMGAGESRKISIVRLNGQFLEAELILCKIEANGHTYFKRRFFQRFINPVIISTYDNPWLDLNEEMTYEQRLNLYGVKNPKRKFKDPYPDKGGAKWLLNLFVEWLR